MKDRASLHLVKDNAAVVEGVTIQMLVLFHASLNITTIVPKSFRPVPFCVRRWKGPFSLSQSAKEPISYCLLGFQDEILIERAAQGHSQPSRFSLTSLSNRRREEIEETAA